MRTTIQQVIDTLTAPVSKLENTVDSLWCGHADAEVTGIVSTFMPTQHVLETAIRRHCNLIIAHEGPYYSHHQDFVRVIQKDPVYKMKEKLFAEKGLALYRFHDYIHRYRPDGIMEGLLAALEWDDYVLTHTPVCSVVRIPAMTGREIASWIKNKLRLEYVRGAGNLEFACTRIGLFAGYRGGGQHVIPSMEKHKLDLVIYGEGPEWESPEYVRDAVRQGRTKALLALGHAESEAPGMELLARRLEQRFPHIPVHFVADEPVFHVL